MQILYNTLFLQTLQLQFYNITRLLFWWADLKYAGPITASLQSSSSVTACIYTLWPPTKRRHRENNYKDSDAEFTARTFLNIKGKTAEQ